MPRVLTERFRPDSIAEFQTVAQLRWDDARRLLAVRRTSAAIYLFGYVAETALKAAWFRHTGFSPQQPILASDLHAAVNVATSVYGISWPNVGRLHNIQCWSQLVVRHRVALHGPYHDPDFANTAVECGERIYARWRESLRYKSNRPYEHEVATVESAVSWLLGNAEFL